MARDGHGDGETLNCKLCSKSFTTRPSRNRHQLYCRKKLLLGQPNLRKSCAACRRAKTRCDTVIPCCTRCGTKEIECVYEEKATYQKQRPGCERPTLEASSSVIGLSHKSSDQDFPKVSAGLVSNRKDEVHVEPITDELIGISFDGNGAMNWAPEIDFATGAELCDLGDNQEDTEITAFSARINSDPMLEVDYAIGDDQQLVDITGDMPYLNPDMWCLPGILTTLETLPASRECMFDSPYLTLNFIDGLPGLPSSRSILTHRQSPFIQTSGPSPSHLGRSFIVQNLRSYPRMMLDSMNLPPFIHPSTVSIAGDKEFPTELPKPESLSICRNIVQIYLTKTKQTAAFVWRTITTEQERMSEDYLEGDEWNVLAMLQTITIFILLRIFDEDAFTVDFDNQLVQTMTAIAIRSERSGFISSDEVQGYRSQWHEWILMESKRRTVTLLFVIHLLFDINPGQRAKAVAGLSALPLPANKMLWQASTKEEWTKHYDHLLNAREGEKYLTYRDLVNLGQSRCLSHNLRMKNLNEWFISVDSFGILIMMAATIF